MILSGNKELAEQYIGEGHSLAQICASSVVFQDLGYYRMNRNFFLTEKDFVSVQATCYGPMKVIRIDAPFLEKEEKAKAQEEVTTGDFVITVSFARERDYQWVQDDPGSPFKRVPVSDIFEDDVQKDLADVLDLYFTINREESGGIRISFNEDSFTAIHGVCSMKSMPNASDESLSFSVCQCSKSKSVLFMENGETATSHRVVAVHNTYFDCFLPKGDSVVCFNSFPKFGSTPTVVNAANSTATYFLSRPYIDRYSGGAIARTTRPIDHRTWTPYPTTADALFNIGVVVKRTHDGFIRPVVDVFPDTPQFDLPTFLNPPEFAEDAFFPTVHVKRENVSGDFFRNVEVKFESFGAIHPLVDFCFDRRLFSTDETYSDYELGYRRSWLFASRIFFSSGNILDFELTGSSVSLTRVMPVIPSGGGTEIERGEKLLEAEVNEISFSALSTKRVVRDSWPPESESLLSRSPVVGWENNWHELEDLPSFESLFISGINEAYIYGRDDKRHYFHSGYDNYLRLRSPLYVGGADRLAKCRIDQSGVTMVESDLRPFESISPPLFSRWTTHGLALSEEIAIHCEADVDPVYVDIDNDDSQYPYVEISHGKNYSVKCSGVELFYCRYAKQSYKLKIIAERSISSHFLGGETAIIQQDLLDYDGRSTWVDKPPTDSQLFLDVQMIGDTPLFYGRSNFLSTQSSKLLNGMVRGLRHEVYFDHAYTDFFSYIAVFNGEPIDIATPFIHDTNWSFFSSSSYSLTHGRSLSPHVYCFDKRRSGKPRLDVFCEAIEKDHSLYRDPRYLADETISWRIYVRFGEEQAIDVSTQFMDALRLELLSRGRTEDELVDLENKIRLFSPTVEI